MKPINCIYPFIRFVFLFLSEVSICLRSERLWLFIGVRKTIMKKPFEVYLFFGKALS